MWHTSDGERILEGAEARIFAEALSKLIVELDLSKNDEDGYDLGIHAFDRLTYGEKISALYVIGNGLLRKDIPIIKLTAVLEASIATVFKNLLNAIIFEIDEPEIKTNWRKMVVAARKEGGGEQIPSPKCNDIQEWNIEVEELAYWILWDADYESEHLFVDSDPDFSNGLKQLTGVSKDYYLGIVDDLNDKEIEIKSMELKNLCLSVIDKK